MGNGVTDDEFEGNNALVPFAHGMGLISHDLYEVSEQSLFAKISLIMLSLLIVKLV